MHILHHIFILFKALQYLFIIRIKASILSMISKARCDVVFLLLYL